MIVSTRTWRAAALATLTLLSLPDTRFARSKRSNRRSIRHC